MSQAHKISDPREPTSREIICIADLLDLPDPILARALKCSDAVVAEYRTGAPLIENSDHLETAHALVAVFSRIHTGPGWAGTLSQWMRHHDARLGGVPIELIERDHGLTHLLAAMTG